MTESELRPRHANAKLTGRLRVAFVGQRTYFEVCSLHEHTAAVEPRFIDFRGGDNTGDLLRSLRAFEPDVVVVFRPEIIPRGLFADLPKPVLGFMTEPLPRGGERSHEQLEQNLSELERADPGNFDRVICFDPFGWEAAAARLPAWRSMPLPVDDRVFKPVDPASSPARALFLGYSTPHREEHLSQARSEVTLRHYAHGLMGEELLEALAWANIGINMHQGRLPLSFENRVLLHLASGHLVVSEPLKPRFGLVPDVDYLEVVGPDRFKLVMRELCRQPHAYDPIRFRGREAADRFRASRVWPEVLTDFLADLRASGSARGHVTY
jgi:hypothetical protein